MKYIITENSITVFIENKPISIYSSDTNFNKVKECIKNNNEDEIIKLIDMSKNISEELDGTLAEIRDGVIFYDNKEVSSYLSSSIIKMYNEGFNVEPFLNFMNNLMENPSKRAVDELYGFLEASKLPITDDGYFLAYKKVRDDFKDIYSGQFDNSVGSVCEMKRNEVNDNKEETCSSGLHFAAYSYMSHYGTGEGNKIVVVKINPKDVVSIPVDYNNAKGRCCRYEVVDEVEVDEIEYSYTKKYSTTEDTEDEELDRNIDIYISEENEEQLELNYLKDMLDNSVEYFENSFDYILTILDDRFEISDSTYYLLENSEDVDYFASVLMLEINSNEDIEYEDVISLLETLNSSI